MFSDVTEKMSPTTGQDGYLRHESPGASHHLPLSAIPASVTSNSIPRTGSWVRYSCTVRTILHALFHITVSRLFHQQLSERCLRTSLFKYLVRISLGRGANTQREKNQLSSTTCPALPLSHLIRSTVEDNMYQSSTGPDATGPFIVPVTSLRSLIWCHERFRV